MRFDSGGVDRLHPATEATVFCPAPSSHRHDTRSDSISSIASSRRVKKLGVVGDRGDKGCRKSFITKRRKIGRVSPSRCTCRVEDEIQCGGPGGGVRAGY